MAVTQRNTNVTFHMTSLNQKNDLQVCGHLSQLKAVSLQALPNSLRSSSIKVKNSPLASLRFPPGLFYSPCSLWTIRYAFAQHLPVTFCDEIPDRPQGLGSLLKWGVRVWQSQDMTVALTSLHPCSWISLFLPAMKLRISSNLRKEGSFQPAVWRYSLLWWRGHGSWLLRQLLTLYPQSEVRERWRWHSAHFVLFIQARSLVHGMLLFIFRLGLPSLGRSFLKCPYRRPKVYLTNVLGVL